MSRLADIWRTWWWVAVMAVGLVVAYGLVLDAPFLFDDFKQVVNHSQVTGIALPRLSARVVGLLSLRWGYALHGPSPAGFRLFNIGVHVAAGLALAGLCHTIIARSAACRTYRRRAGRIAVAAALLWTLHPLQTASVTYITQRFESLMGVFFLTALYAFVRCVAGGRAGWGIAAILACALGMATKEVMIALPFVALTIDYVFFHESGQRFARGHRWVHAGLFLCIGIVVLLSRVQVEAHAAVGYAVVPRQISAWRYLFTQPAVILHYVRLALLPWGQCLDYGWPPVETLKEGLAGAVLMALVVAGALWATCRRRPCGALILSFFVILAPSSSIIPIADLAFEHRMYLPLACLAVAVAVGLDHGAAWVAARWRVPSAACLYAWLGGGLAVVLVLLTAVRNHTYRSEVAMWTDVVRKRPMNLRAQANLGVALAQDQQWAPAVAHFEQVLAATDDDVKAFLRQRDSGGATGIDAGGRLEGRFLALMNLGALSSRVGDFSAAADHYGHALELMPRSSQARERLERAQANRRRSPPVRP